MEPVKLLKIYKQSFATKTMTDIFLIPAKYIPQVEVPESIIKKLPDKLMLFSSVQFLDQLPEISKQLEVHGKQILMVKSKNFCI